jgi:hypothetical protein
MGEISPNLVTLTETAESGKVCGQKASQCQEEEKRVSAT